jgi:hypothetical protein
MAEDNSNTSKRSIRLDEIVGECSMARKLRAELCGDLWEAAVGIISDSDLRLAMMLHDIHLKSENGRLFGKHPSRGNPTRKFQG